MSFRKVIDLLVVLGVVLALTVGSASAAPGSTKLSAKFKAPGGTGYIKGSSQVKDNYAKAQIETGTNSPGNTGSSSTSATAGVGDDKIGASASATGEKTKTSSSAEVKRTDEGGAGWSKTTVKKTAEASAQAEGQGASVNANVV